MRQLNNLPGPLSVHKLALDPKLTVRTTSWQNTAGNLRVDKIYYGIVKAANLGMPESNNMPKYEKFCLLKGRFLQVNYWVISNNSPELANRIPGRK